MSAASWLEEYYPVPAALVEGEQPALEHSILKWTGLLPENLHKHDITMSANLELFERGNGKSFMVVDAANCALCLLYQGDSCQNCPIMSVRGAPCCTLLPGNPAPWHQMLYESDPKPMIQVLKDASKRNPLKRTLHYIRKHLP